MIFDLDSIAENSYSKKQKHVFNRNFSNLFDHYKHIYEGGSQQELSSSRIFTSSSYDSNYNGHCQSQRELRTKLI